MSYYHDSMLVIYLLKYCTLYSVHSIVLHLVGTESNNMEYSLLQQKVLTEITVMFTFLDR